MEGMQSHFAQLRNMRPIPVGTLAMQEADRGIMLHFKQELALMPKII
jgi:hypothetical protein